MSLSTAREKVVWVVLVIPCKNGQKVITILSSIFQACTNATTSSKVFAWEITKAPESLASWRFHQRIHYQRHKQYQRVILALLVHGTNLPSSFQQGMVTIIVRLRYFVRLSRFLQLLKQWAFTVLWTSEPYPSNFSNQFGWVLHTMPHR